MVPTMIEKGASGPAGEHYGVITEAAGGHTGTDTEFDPAGRESQERGSTRPPDQVKRRIRIRGDRLCVEATVLGWSPDHLGQVRNRDLTAAGILPALRRF